MPPSDSDKPTSESPSGDGSFRAWTEENQKSVEKQDGAESETEARSKANLGEDIRVRQSGAEAPSRPATSRERNELLDLRREALDIRAEAREMREEGKAFRSEAEEMRRAATERMEASRKFANAGTTELQKFTAKAERLTEDLKQTGQEAAGSVKQAGREAVKAIRAEAERQGADVTKAIRQTAREQAGRVLGAMEERQGEMLQTTSEAAEIMQRGAARSARQVKNERRQLKEAVSERERSARWSADKIEHAAKVARQTTWKSWAIIVVVAVLLPTTFMLGMTWMRPGWGLTDHQRSGMEVGTGVVEEYDQIHQSLQSSLNDIETLRRGTHPETGRALAEWQREDLRSRVLTKDSMRASLERLEVIRSAVGWRPSEYTRKLTRQVSEVLEGKALPGK